MLKPPRGDEYQVHNFERILIQQKQDAEFFEASSAHELAAKGLAGIGALVQRLEREYSHYLNDTWKKGAMRKVLEKLEEKKFELKMLGVVTEESQQQQLAKMEVERRLGPTSPIMDIYTDFLSTIVRDMLCTNLRSQLSYLERTTWQGYDIDEQLEHITGIVDSTLTLVLDRVQVFWQGRLQDILTAESKLDTDETTAESNIVTTGRTGISLRLFTKGRPKIKVRKEIKEKPFIQLSKYKQFTDKILLKCQKLFQEAVSELKVALGDMKELLVAPNSPWLEFHPHLLQGGAASQEPVSSEVLVICDLDRFLNSIAALFLRRVPSPKALKDVHDGIPLGKAEDEALSQHALLMNELAKVESARDGICRALPFSDIEMSTLQREVEGE